MAGKSQGRDKSFHVKTTAALKNLVTKLRGTTPESQFLHNLIQNQMLEALKAAKQRKTLKAMSAFRWSKE